MAKGKGLEAGAGALQFMPINDLARGGTISSSIAFRIIPGPSVPLNQTPPVEQIGGAELVKAHSGRLNTVALCVI